MLDIFDILGPIMIGPSSSHTAGAVRIGRMARTLLGEKPVKAEHRSIRLLCRDRKGPRHRTARWWRAFWECGPTIFASRRASPWRRRKG